MTSSLLQSVQSISCRCYVNPMQSSRKGETGARGASSSPLLLGSPAVARHLHATSSGHTSQFAMHPCSCVQLAPVMSLMSCGRDFLSIEQRLSGGSASISQRMAYHNNMISGLDGALWLLAGPLS